MKDRVPHNMDPELKKKARGLSPKQIEMLSEIYDGFAKQLERMARMKPGRQARRNN